MENISKTNALRMHHIAAVTALLGVTSPSLAAPYIPEVTVVSVTPADGSVIYAGQEFTPVVFSRTTATISNTSTSFASVVMVNSYIAAATGQVYATGRTTASVPAKTTHSLNNDLSTGLPLGAFYIKGACSAKVGPPIAPSNSDSKQNLFTLKAGDPPPP